MQVAMTSINFRSKFVGRVSNAMLWLLQPFVTQPGIGAQRTQGKILCPLCWFDFMNVDGIPAMSHQDFLGLGFLLGRPDSHPDQQTLPFRLLVHSQSAFSIQPPPHSEHRYASDGESDQHR
jgi:hypothetical protein